MVPVFWHDNARAHKIRSYFQAEIDAIAEIYGLRFPDRKIRLMVYAGDEFTLGVFPAIVVDEVPLQLEQVSAHFIGMVECGAPAAGTVTIYVTIPPPPNPAQLQEVGAVWHPGRWISKYAAVYAPVLFEYGKYRDEMKQRARRKLVNHWEKISRPRSTVVAPNAFRRPPGEMPPAILLALHWLEVGGAESLAFDCVQYARRAGLRVFVVADVPALQRKQTLLHGLEDVTFIRLDKYLAPEHWVLYLAGLVAQENVRAIHIHHCTTLYGCLPHLKYLFPDLLAIDSTHIIEHRDGGFPRISAVWSPYIDVHHVISRELEAFYRVEFFRTENVRLGRLIKQREMPEAGFRLQPGAKSCTVSFVGRLTHQKRPFLVIAIMLRLARWGERNGVSFGFNVVGEGPYRQACRTLAGRHRVGGPITFHAADSDVGRILDGSDILLLASANEGLALVCFEAIRHGAIPVSTEVGGQGELLPPALLTDPEPFACARQSVEIIQKLLTDAVFNESATAALRARFIAMAAEPSAAEVIGEIYANIVAEASVP
jgi:glycosyltransferase involved in cell wall biosynthesis